MPTPIKDPIPNQDKNICGYQKDQCLTSDVPPFLPGNKSLLNEENGDNPETTDTSQYEKYNTLHTKRYDYIANVQDTKILMMMMNKNRILRNIKAVMKVLIILKLRILHVMKLLSTQPKKNKHLLNG